MAARSGKNGDQLNDLVQQAMSAVKGERSGDKSGKKNKMMEQLFAH